MAIEAQTPTLYINGKFVAQNMTGVQRVAHEAVLAIDRMLASSTPRAGACVLVCPPGSRPPHVRRIKIRFAGPRMQSLGAWEQLVLPWAARDGILLNLAGSAPWLSAPRSICVMHDAAVFEHADAYTFAFRMWYRLLFRRLGARAGALVTVSQFSQGRLARVLGVDPARLQVVHNGADHFSRIEADASVLDAYGLSPQRYVLIVGTEKRTKNIRPLLDVWCSLPRDPGQVLVWVGGGNRRVFSPSADLDKTPEELAGDAIVRTGVICDERLKALYENAAALVVPSTYEGFGFPAVEAMAAGCPVLVARSAALPEICGTAALYFEPTDLEHAGALLRRLLADEPLRRGMVDRGRARARLFSWDSVGTALALQAEVLTSRLCVAQ